MAMPSTSGLISQILKCVEVRDGQGERIPQAKSQQHVGVAISYDRSGIFRKTSCCARFIKNSDSICRPNRSFDHTCMLQLITYFG